MGDAGEFFVELMRGIWQDKTIKEMEGYIHSTPPVRDTPDPNTSHPALSHCENFVRGHQHLNHIRVMAINNRNLRAEWGTYPVEDVATKTAILTRKVAYGPAPYVGDPLRNDAVYAWNYYVDDHGRYISCDSRLVWRFG